jgi:hypothetical protein
MVFTPMDRCIGIMGIALLMAMGCCMFIVGIMLLVDMARCMGIIILDAPPGGLAAALSRRPKMAHIARAARIGPQKVRNICLSPIEWGMKMYRPRSVVIPARRWQWGGEECATAGCMRVR